MRKSDCIRGVLLFTLSVVGPFAHAQVIFHEVMYHSRSGNRAEEFVELYNDSSETVDLTAWQVTDGIRYLFPPGTKIGPGAFLVVASDPETMRPTLPEGTSALGPYKKKLSHKADRVELRRPEGTLVDAVAYEDSSPWPTEADGKGPSLELVNPGAPRFDATAWRASTLEGGTPGRQNSVFDPQATVWLIHGRHEPPVPNSHDSITLQVETFGTTVPASVRAIWWADGSEKWDQVQLKAEPGTPNLWRGAMGPLPDKSLIEYRFTAAFREGGKEVPFPPAVVGQPEGYLLQVDDTPTTTSRPVYRLLVRKKDWETLKTRPVMSNDLLPGAFFAKGVSCQRVGFRYRGHSSRGSAPRKSYLVRFPPWEPFRGRRDHAFNANYFEGQYTAMRAFAAAGIECPDVDLVGLKINGEPTGYYCWMEEIDEDFARRHFNEPDQAKIWEGKRNADFAYRGTDPKAYAGYVPVMPDKEVDPAPIIGLCDALQPRENTTDFQFRADQAVDVEEWVRFFAVNALIANIEGGLTTTKGEDYYLAQPSSESRFILLPWDVNESFLVPYFPITAPQVDAVRRFLSHEAFAPRYRAEVRRLLDTVFSLEARHKMLEAVTDVAEPQSLAILKDFLSARPHELEAQLPETIGVVVRNPGPRSLVGPGANWKLFYRGYPPKPAPGAWTEVEYDDTMANEWYDASMPFGWSPEGLLGEYGKGSYIPAWAESEGEITFHVRRRFTWNEDRPPKNLRLILRYSAGYVAYLNGKEISRMFLPPGPIQQTTRAIVVNPITTPVAIDLRPYADQIRKGENVIAIELHMTSRQDPRRVLDAVLLEGDPRVGRVVLGNPQVRFTGEAPVPPVREIRMEQERYAVDPWTAEWKGEVLLSAGWNRLTLSGRDERGDAVSTATATWYHAERATQAPQRIEGEVAWTEKNSPYRISELMEISEGASLRLEPGTVVVIDPWVNVRCRGSLLATGTPEKPVTIAGLDADASWGSIAGVGERSRIVLHHTNLSGSSHTYDPQLGPPDGTLGGIESWKGKLEADHCVVEDSIASAFVGRGGADVVLRNCRMERVGCGFLGIESGWTVEDCVVLHTRNKGDAIDVDGEGPRPSVARRCVFGDLADDGIDFGGCSATVEDCVVWGARDKGISLDGGGRPVFRRCLVGDCNMALAVKVNTKVILEQSALLASRLGVTTTPRGDQEPSGAAELNGCLVARCAVPFQGGRQSVSVRNVCVDSLSPPETKPGSPLKGTVTPGLSFADPARGNWAVTAPVTETERGRLGPPMGTLSEMASRNGVLLRDTGLRLLGWE